MRARLGPLALAALVAAGCAEVGRPGGGPADTTPPIVVGSRPDSLAVSVPRDAPLHLLFNEKVDRGSIARALKFTPDVEVGKPAFRDRMVTVRPQRGWPADSVVVWTLGTGLKDRHGVAMATPHQGAFTTADRMPWGAVEGSARVAEEDPKKRAQIRADLLLPPAAGSRRATLWRWALARDDGSFRLDLLEVPSGPYQLSVYLDRNANGTRDEREPVARVDSLYLAEADSILRLDPLDLIDIEAPVALGLCLAPDWPDSLRVYGAWAAVTGGANQKAALDTLGCAEARLVPGEVSVSAWLDLDADGFFGPDSTGTSEPYLLPRAWELRPATPDTIALEASWTTLSWAEMDTLRPPPLPREFFKKGNP